MQNRKQFHKNLTLFAAFAFVVLSLSLIGFKVGEKTEMMTGFAVSEGGGEFETDEPVLISKIRQNPNKTYIWLFSCVIWAVVIGIAAVEYETRI